MKIIDAVELIFKAKRSGQLPQLVRRRRLSASRCARYQGIELALGTRPFVADIEVAGLAARRRGAFAACACPRAGHRHQQGRCAGRRGEGRHGQGCPWRSLGRSDLQGLAGSGGRGRGSALRRRCPRRGRRGDSAHCACGGCSGGSRLRSCCRPCSIRPRPSSPGAPQVNPKHDNVLSRTKIERGDVDAALASSAHVVSGTWRTQRIEHLFLEPEAALAVPLDDGRLHLLTQGQGVFDDRRQVASVLGEAEDKIFVELVPNGGAFGGKEDMTIQAQTALAGASDRQARANRAEPRRIDPHAPQAASHHHDLHGGLRWRGTPDRRPDQSAGRLGRLCLGRRQGDRAGGRTCLRTVPDSGHRHRGRGRLHQQSALRRHARLRRQPDQFRHRRLPGSAGEESRHRRLGNALAQRRAHRRRFQQRSGAGQVPWPGADAVGCERHVLRRAQAAAVRLASPAASRIPASATAPSKKASAGWRWRPTPASACIPASPRWDRACSP